MLKQELKVESQKLKWQQVVEERRRINRMHPRMSTAQ